MGVGTRRGGRIVRSVCGFGGDSTCVAQYPYLMQFRSTVACLAALFAGQLSAQVTAPVAAPSDERPEVYAVTGARVYVTPDRVVDDATLVVRDGRVAEVTEGGAVPPGAVEVDAAGKTVVAAFVDLASDYGQPEVEAAERNWSRPQYGSETPGAYSWNEALKAEYDAAEHFTRNAERAAALRKLGFGTVLTHRPDGISRGSAALVTLGDAPEQEALLTPRAAHVMSFSKGGSSQMYPSSLMGMIALLRQTYYDADWYANHGGREEERNLSLEGWLDLQSLPQLFSVGAELEALRALELGREFDRRYILLGDGDAYQRLDGFRENERFVVPLNFPDAYDVADPYDAQMADYADMLHWELAAANPVYLAQAGHEVALTLDRLDADKEESFFARLARVHEAGMSDADLLRALTTTPASFVGAAEEVGSLEAGRLASFVVLEEWPVEAETKVYQTWVAGQPHEITPFGDELAAGTYRVVVDGDDAWALAVDGEEAGKIAPAGYPDSLRYDATLTRTGERVMLSYPADTTEGADRVRLSGRIGKAGAWSGMGYDAEGAWVAWTATPEPSAADDGTEDDGDGEDATEEALPARPAYTDLPKPFAPYGNAALPAAGAFVVRGATVWTNEDAGIVEDADVYVVDGRIAGFGGSLSVPSGTEEIDGTGKHLTSGIIDEHSHIAISRGVNAGSQESTAEVRIGDVVNSEDVNIFRHLAGGVTAAQLLHGSANPIGGQSALIKMRWGALPEDLKIEGADGFIKFALGENVKQSNWGSAFTTRYPQTRMGVEQVYDDYFTRAAAYYAERQAGAEAVRRDLDLEALAEILNAERFITCHSYRQSEINMLMKVAERHGFTVNTFTHILEGYKVADKMAEHGVGASTFSDWWAYKFEVWDAIPANGPIMHEQGVTVAYNSDDAELGRRLNQEAGKAAQEGVPEEEAWKFVTLNPAKLLHLDDRMGSVRVGKDADLVLWNDHPMSIYALAEKTWVDGALYFDRDAMRARRDALAAERNRLAQAMLAEAKAGAPTQPVEGRGGRLDECDSLHD